MASVQTGGQDRAPVCVACFARNTGSDVLLKGSDYFQALNQRVADAE